MGNLLSKDVYLNLDKDIDVEVYTNIKNKFKNKKLIKNYVKDNIENMGASMNNYISNYLHVKKISIKNKKNIIFNIKFKINKKGKKIKGSFGKKINENKLKEYLTFNTLKEHIEWCLNESSFRAEPLKLKEGKFTISDNNIKKIILT